MITDIGIDLARILGGHMASAEGGSVLSGVRYGEGCNIVSSPSGVQGRAESGFRHILKQQNAPFCTYVTKSEGNNLH